MPLEYDEAVLKKAQQLVAKTEAERKKVAKHLKKIKDGFFKGEGVVLGSGLTKAEVQQIADAQEKSKKYSGKWQQLEKGFKDNLKKAYLSRKKELDQEMRSIDGDYKGVLKEFPDFKGILGAGPESDLKKALKLMG